MLGLWIEQTEGAKFWHRVMTELQARGVEDILIALDRRAHRLPRGDQRGLPPDPDPYLRRASGAAELGLRLLPRPESASPPRCETIYRAETVAAGDAALAAFAASPDGARYPTITPIWRRQWDRVTPAFAYPPAIRRILTTTNAIESLHMQLRKIIKTRGHLPTDEAATKLLYLALRNIKKRWPRPQPGRPR